MCLLAPAGSDPSVEFGERLRGPVRVVRERPGTGRLRHRLSPIAILEQGQYRIRKSRRIARSHGDGAVRRPVVHVADVCAYGRHATGRGLECRNARRLMTRRKDRQECWRRREE